MASTALRSSPADSPKGAAANNNTPANSKASRRFTNLSYGKCLVGLWALVLVLVCVKQVFYVMGLVSFLLTCALLPTTEGDAKMLVPLFMLSERLLVDSTSLRHSPVMFLSCALFAYAADASTSAVSSASSRTLLSGVYGTVGIAAMYFLTSQMDLALALGAYFFIALFVYSLLSRRVTIREAVIVAHLAGFLACDAMVNTNIDPAAVKELTITSFTHIGGRCSLLMGLAVCCSAYIASRLVPARVWYAKDAIFRTYFFVVVTSTTTAGAYVYCSRVFKEDPAMWLISYVGSSPIRFLALFGWCVGIPIAIMAIARLKASKSPLPLTVHRKLFHVLAVVAFLPVGIYDPEFLGFSVMLAVTLGILAECARKQRIMGTRAYNAFMLANIDERDTAAVVAVAASAKGKAKKEDRAVAADDAGIAAGTSPSDSTDSNKGGAIIRTHLFLMCGLALPIMLHARQQQMVARPLAPIVLVALFLLPGIVGLGVMDAAAATCGCYVARWKAAGAASGGGAPAKKAGASTKASSSINKLSNFLCGKYFTTEANPALTHKTVEGTLGGLLAACLAWGLIVAYVFGAPTHFRTVVPSIAGIVCGCLFEAFVDGIDNLELPIFMAGIIQTAVLVLGKFF